MNFSFTEICIKNYGVSFNLISDASHILIILLGVLSLVIVVSVLAFRIFKIARISKQTKDVEQKQVLKIYSHIYAVSFSLVVVGGLINMIFRGINGYVCDYIELSLQANTIFFNIPDVMIVTGIAIFALIELIGRIPSEQ